MVILKKRELDYLSSSTDFVNKDFRRLSLNIVVLFIALIVISNIAVFRLSKIQANSLKTANISEYRANIAVNLLNKKTNLTIGDKSEMEVLTMEDLTVKPKYISNSNYYLYSGKFSAYSTPANRTWAHAYDLYYNGYIHGSNAGRWCTFFAQMWFYDVFGFNSSGNYATGDGKDFAYTVYQTATYYDEDGNLKHYFELNDHPETMSIVSVYMSREEGHVLCVDEVDYENGTITISEGNPSGTGDVRIRETMSLDRFYSLNPGYKVYATPTEELLKMISSR